jgi:hypothetical protein
MGPISQSNWRDRGAVDPNEKSDLFNVATPRRPYDPNRIISSFGVMWSNWAAVRFAETTEGRLSEDLPDITTEQLEKDIATLVESHMTHSGILFGLPYLPSMGEGSLGALGHILPKDNDSRLCHDISNKVARTIVGAEVRQLLEEWKLRWKKDIEENGVQVVAKHWPGESRLGLGDIHQYNANYFSQG